VMPVSSVDALERPTSQPNLVQSWTEGARFAEGGGGADAVSSLACDGGAAPHATSSGRQSRPKMGTQRWLTMAS
jgi:hypothetical protein